MTSHIKASEIRFADRIIWEGSVYQAFPWPDQAGRSVLTFDFLDHAGDEIEYAIMADAKVELISRKTPEIKPDFSAIKIIVKASDGSKLGLTFIDEKTASETELALIKAGREFRREASETAIYGSPESAMSDVCFWLAE